jgi:hypothetical protein
MSQVTDIEPRRVHLCQDSLSAPFVAGGGGEKKNKASALLSPILAYNSWAVL